MRVDLSRYLPLRTEKVLGGKRKLLRDLTIGVDDTFYTAPEGFITDLSTYPWLSRLIVRFDRVDEAGAIHDWLYYTGSESRSDADYVWRCIAMGGEVSANPVQAWVSWIGLRAGGWFAWRKHRRGKYDS